MAPRFPGKLPSADTGGVWGALTNMFEGLLGNVLQGITAGLAAPFAFLADLMNLRWDQVDRIDDGQVEMNDRVDLLSPLQDYGSCFAAGQGDLINTGRVPFNQQIGPMVGCHLASNGIVLDDQGLWDIRARLRFSFTVSPINTWLAWEIRVYAPNNSLFSAQLDEVSDMNSNTREMNTTVVVPGPGYRAEVWITNLAPVRATQGGPRNNRFTVQHITRSTDNPI